MQGDTTLKVAKRMFENVLGESRRELQEAVSPVLSPFGDLLRQKALIQIQGDQVDFDAILEDYKCCITGFDGVYQLQEHCLKFLEVLENLGKPAIAETLRKRWEKKIQEQAMIEFRLTKAVPPLAPPQQPAPLVPSISPPSLHSGPPVDDLNRWGRNFKSNGTSSWNQQNKNLKENILKYRLVDSSCTTNGHDENQEETTLLSNQNAPSNVHDDDSRPEQQISSNEQQQISSNEQQQISSNEQQQISSNEVNITNNTSDLNNNEEREEGVEEDQPSNTHETSDAYVHNIIKTTGVKEDNGLRKREKGHETSHEHIVTTLCKVIETQQQQHMQHLERVFERYQCLIYFFMIICCLAMFLYFVSFLLFTIFK